MQTQDIEVYSSASNAAVVRAPGRRFPGVVVQGDTLAALVASARHVAECAAIGADEDLVWEARSLVEGLSGLLDHYERTMREHGLPLPYGPAQSRP